MDYATYVNTLFWAACLLSCFAVIGLLLLVCNDG